MAPQPSWKKPAGATEYAPSHFNLGPPVKRGELVGIYGNGGSGKTTLAALIERTMGPVGFIDLDDSLGVLADTLGDLGLSPQSVSGLKTWAEVIGLMESNVFDGVKNVIVDTASEAENMAMRHVIDTIKCESGATATSIESYGYGKGYRYLYETFLDLRTAMLGLAAQGKNVILIMHSTTCTVPHPDGPDYIRYEPKLYQDKAVSLRTMMQDKLDHLLFIGYDISVEAADARKGKKHGKASGGGTRTIYPAETATCMAKSRRLHDPLPYEYGDDALWRALFNKPEPQGS